MVDAHREGFAFLTRLACKRAGRCVDDLRRTIEHCLVHPDEEDCLRHAPCPCAADLYSALRSFVATGRGDLLRLDDAVAVRVEEAGRSCKCDDVNSRAAALELSGPCALAGKIMEERDLLAGDAAAIADACDDGDGGGGTTSCVDDAVAVLDEFVEFDCAFAEADADFLRGVRSGRDDLERIADFACDGACYTSFRTCHHYYDDDAACLESIACSCQRDFVNFVKGLSADSRRDLLEIDAAAFEDMEAGIDTCECDRANRGVASAVNDGSCALHVSIIREGHLFAGNSSDIQSTCPRPTSCVDEVTESVARVIDQGCEIRQRTDLMAKIVYNLNNPNNSSEWEDITGFACDVDHSAASANATYGGCYDEIKVVVEACQNGAAADCTASATPGCLESFLGTAGRLSDGGRGGLLGIDASTMGRIEAWDFVESTTSPTVQPTTQAPTSGASVQTWLTAAIVSSTLVPLVA